MDIVALQTYLDYSEKVNKDTLNSNKKQSSQSADSSNTKKEEQENIDQINEKQHASKEEILALYVSHEATQAMKSRIDTLFDSMEVTEDDESLSYEDIRSISQMVNRYVVMEEKSNQSQDNTRTISVWA